MVDGINKCAWEGGACVTTAEKLDQGMVGITSVPDVGMGMPETGTDDLGPPTNDRFCSMPPDSSASTGVSCMAYMEMFSYNKTTDACEKVVYGGCGATQNLFKTLEDCETAAAEFCGLEKESTIAAGLDNTTGKGEDKLTAEETFTSSPSSSAMMQQSLLSIAAVVSAYSSWILTIV